MTRTCGWLATAFLSLALLVVMTPAAVSNAAAQAGLPCGVDAAPSETLASAAFGLTRPEMDALYGPGIAAQSGWIYQFSGFDLTLADCDLILHIDPDSEFTDAEAATRLVRTLLPEDAVLAGSWQFGTIQSLPQDGDEWLSADLAARYRLLGEPRTGAILVLYTYAGNAYTPGPVDHVELRAALIPEP